MEVPNSDSAGSRVILKDEAKSLADFAGVTKAQIEKATRSEGGLALLTNPIRIYNIHWFEGQRAVFVSGVVTKADQGETANADRRDLC